MDSIQQESGYHTGFCLVCLMEKERVVNGSMNVGGTK